MNPTPSIDMFNDDDAFIEELQPETSGPPAPFVAATAPMQGVRESISPDDFSVFDNSQYQSTPQPEVYTDIGDWNLPPQDIYQPHPDLQYQQPLPILYQPGGFENLGAHHHQSAETNVVPGTSNGFSSNSVSRLVEANPSRYPYSPSPVPQYPSMAYNGAASHQPQAVYRQAAYHSRAAQHTPAVHHAPVARHAPAAYPVLAGLQPAAMYTPKMRNIPSMGCAPSLDDTPALSQTPSPGRTPVTPDTPAVDQTVVTDAPALDQSEDDDSSDSEETVDPWVVLKRTLSAKEKKARAMIKKQMRERKVETHMGESFSIAQTSTRVRFTGKLWTAPANDETIPTSDAEIKAHIDTLELEMRNLKNVREKPNTGQAKNRWSENSVWYAESDFNAAAGDLVDALIEIHQNGWTKPIYDKGERENCQMTMFYTFEDRFSILRELLRCSKTTCQDILKGSRFWTILANPRTLIFRTATNKTANVNKAVLIKAGKSALDTDGKGVSSEQENTVGEERPAGEEPATTMMAPKGKKRARKDVSVAEEPAAQPPRKKAAVKKRRAA